MPARDAAPLMILPVVPYIGPTSVSTLNRCLLRVAFSRSNPHRRLVAIGPLSRLGTIAHAVLESVGRGMLDSYDPDSELWRAEFENLWAKVVAVQREDAASSFVDAALGAPERWPFYSLRRSQTRFLAQRLTRSRREATTLSTVSLSAEHSHQALAQVHSPAAQVGPELNLVAFDGRLRGRPDNVVLEPDGVGIEDFKSGAIYEDVDDQAAQPRIRAGYRLQLLLYAAMYNDEFGLWPAWVRLVPFVGAPETIVVDAAAQAEASAAVEKALAGLSKYEAARLVSNPSDLASPSQEACQDCPYRGACDAFWAAAKPDWSLNDRIVCTGRVESLQTHADGTVALTLVVANGFTGPETWLVRRLTQDQVRSPLGPISTSDIVRIVGLRHRDDVSPTEFYADERSEVWRVEMPISTYYSGSRKF